MQIIKNLYNHLAGRDKGNLSLDCKYHNLSDYPLQQTLFFNDEDKVRKDIFSIFIYSYMNKFEEYLKSFNKEFTFSYSCEYKEDEDISYYIEWIESENLKDLETFYSYSEKKLLDVEQSFGVLKYYEFLIDNSLQRNNLDAAADFLIGSITNVIDKLEILLSKSGCKNNIKEEQLLIDKLIKMGISSSHTTIKEYSSKEYSSLITKHFSLPEQYHDWATIMESYIMYPYNINYKPAIKQASCI